jgi:hypothetical protein
MDAFWKWLMRANARGVFLCALIALFLVSGWWIWRAMSPIDYDAGLLHGGGRKAGRVGLGLVAYMEKQLEAGLTVPQNPFYHVVPRVPVRPPTGPTTPPRPPKRPTPPKGPVLKPPKKPERVTLTYYGVYKQNQKQTYALVYDSRKKRRSLYRLGTAVYGLTITGIEQEALTVKPARGKPLVMKFGDAHVFEEGKHVGD